MPAFPPALLSQEDRASRPTLQTAPVGSRPIAACMQALVVLPTYNERENIRDLAEKITALNIAFYVLVIDDNSPDGTGGIVQELARENPKVSLISRPSKQGLGSAYIKGFRFALQNGFDRIVTMDADFSHDPTQLELLIKASLYSDVVIGSRYVDGGRIENWSWFRRGLSRTANELARCVLGHEIGDWTSGYRCYRRHVIEKLPFEEIRSNGYSFLVEVLATCVRLRHRITEVPITFSDRRSGRSKLSRLEICKGVLTLLRLGMQEIRSRVARAQ
jgi:dolichol-phosphate mannosyltransferase